MCAVKIQMYNSQTFATEDGIGMSKQSSLVKWQMMFFLGWIFHWSFPKNEETQQFNV